MLRLGSQSLVKRGRSISVFDGRMVLPERRVKGTLTLGDTDRRMNGSLLSLSLDIQEKTSLEGEFIHRSDL